MLLSLSPKEESTMSMMITTLDDGRAQMSGDDTTTVCRTLVATYAVTRYRKINNLQ